MKYVLRTGNDYYGGSTYIYQGSYFAVLTRRDDARRYTTEARANSAAKKLNEKVGETFHVEEVSE